MNNKQLELMQLTLSALRERAKDYDRPAQARIAYKIAIRMITLALKEDYDDLLPLLGLKDF